MVALVLAALAGAVALAAFMVARGSQGPQEPQVSEGTSEIMQELDNFELAKELDTSGLEKEIAQVSESVGGIKFDVQCPANVPAQAGYAFECAVSSSEMPTKFNVQVTQTDALGNLKWSFPPSLTDADLGYSSGDQVAVDESNGPQPSQPVAASGDDFEMPDVVGMVLQDAQDLLQAKGSYLMDQVDATGQGRIQVLDSNWKVCRQSPAPGTSVSTDAMITLAAVKLDESC